MPTDIDLRRNAPQVTVCDTKRADTAKMLAGIMILQAVRQAPP